MILTILAATVVAGGPLPPTEKTPNLYRATEGCGEIQRRVASHQRETFRKLGRLPNAIAEYAVLRQVEGCPVAAPVGYHPPALPGAADVSAKPGDAIPNKP